MSSKTCVLLTLFVMLVCAGRVEAQRFVRADVDANGVVAITDPILTLSFLFSGAAAPVCLDAADANDDGIVNITDPIVTLGFLFLGSAQIPPPGAFGCGEDPTDDGLDCETFPLCPVDPPAPEIAITEPENLTLTRSSMIDIAGTVSADVTSVLVNGVSASLVGTSFSARVSLGEGANTIQALAFTETLEQAAASVEVIRDSTPPRLIISSPGPRDEVTTETITVTGLINDPNPLGIRTRAVTVDVAGRPATVLTNAFEISDVPLAVGANVLRAIVRDAAGNEGSARVLVTRLALDTPRTELVSGDGQSAPIGSQLAAPLVARVVDATGAPVADVDVLFSVTQSDGVLDGGVRRLVARSNAEGLASTTFRLGARAGRGCNRVEASARGYSGRAVFHATSTPAAPAKINPSSGERQNAVVSSTAPLTLGAIVTDRGNNPLAGVLVTYRVVEGGGSFVESRESTHVVATDAAGRVSATLVVGAEPGIENHVVTASVLGEDGESLRPVRYVASAYRAGDPARTRFSGIVLDHLDRPLEGVLVWITGKGQERTSDLTVATDVNGYFTIDGAPVGPVSVFADGRPAKTPGSWPSLHYETTTIAGIDNALAMPIHLLPLDDDVPVAGGAETVIVGLDGVPGFALEVAPHSVTLEDGRRTARVSVTQVRSDKIPMAPGEGMQPNIIVTLQPHGIYFDPPARITYPNVEGMPPGAVMDFFSFDHDIGRFVSIGTGTVSEDGTVVRSDPGFGAIKGGWYCNAAGQSEGDGELPTCRITQGKGQTIFMDETASFSAAGTPNPGNMTWTFPGGSPPSATGTSPSVSYAAAGVYTATARWTCASGNSATDTAQIVVGGAELIAISLPTCVNSGEAIAQSEIRALTEPPGFENDVQYDQLSFTLSNAVGEETRTVTGRLGESMASATIRVINPDGGPQVGTELDLVAIINAINQAKDTVGQAAADALSCQLGDFMLTGSIGLGPKFKCCTDEVRDYNVLNGSIGVGLSRTECPIVGVRRWGIVFGIFLGMLGNGSLSASGGIDPCTEELDWSIAGTVRYGVTLAARIQVASPDFLELSSEGRAFAGFGVSCSNGEGQIDSGIGPVNVLVTANFAGFLSYSLEREVLPRLEVSLPFTCPDPF